MREETLETSNKPKMMPFHSSVFETFCITSLTLLKWTSMSFMSLKRRSEKKLSFRKKVSENQNIQNLPHRLHINIPSSLPCEAVSTHWTPDTLLSCSAGLISHGCSFSCATWKPEDIGLCLSLLPWCQKWLSGWPSILLQLSSFLVLMFCFSFRPIMSIRNVFHVSSDLLEEINFEILGLKQVPIWYVFVHIRNISWLGT